MDVREKLVELIEKASYECDEGTRDLWDMREVADGIADFLIANGVTVQEWKPISEPPEEKGTYLVCTDNGGVLLGHWYGTAWNAGGGANKHLAYWTEKPQPPKGE